MRRNGSQKQIALRRPTTATRSLSPLEASKFELIPAERGEHAFPDTNPLFIGSVLVTPYYFSFATAAFLWSLSTQAAATVYVATATRKARWVLDVRGKTYGPAYKLFGTVEVDALATGDHEYRARLRCQ